MRGLALLAVFAGVFCTVAVAIQPPAAPAQPTDRPARPDGRTGPAGGRDAASVEAAMKGMNRAIRQLRGQAGDGAKREENLRWINDAQRGLVAAKGMPFPEDYLKGAADDAAKTALKEAYRRDLIAVLKKLSDIEQAIFDQKTEDAKKLVEELVVMRDDAHKKFGVKDE